MILLQLSYPKLFLEKILKNLCFEGLLSFENHKFDLQKEKNREMVPK